VDELAAAQLAFHAIAGVLAVLLGRRRAEYRPVAAFVVGVLGADVAKWSLILRVTQPYREGSNKEILM